MKNENNLIAEFMQIPKCQRCENCGAYQYGPGVIFHPKEMKYHSSWDWLMPVIEKISQIKFHDDDTIYPRTFAMINKENGNFMFRFNRHHLFEDEKLIIAAFNAVVDYIQNANR